MEGSERVILTRHGKPMAEIGPLRLQRRKVNWGLMRGEFELKPSWDDWIDEDKFPAGEY